MYKGYNMMGSHDVLLHVQYDLVHGVFIDAATRLPGLYETANGDIDHFLGIDGRSVPCVLYGREEQRERERGERGERERAGRKEGRETGRETGRERKRERTGKRIGVRRGERQRE